MPLWRDDIWSRTWNKETAIILKEVWQRSETFPDNGGDKNPHGEHVLGVFEQWKKDTVDII